MSAAQTSTRRWRWRNIDLAALAVCAVVTLTGYMAGFQPLVQAHNEAVDRQNEVTEMRSRGDQVMSTLNALKRQLANTQNAVEKSPLRLQPVTQINQRLAQLTELAGRSGLALNEIQPGGVQIGQWFATVPIRIQGSGTFQNCVTFIHLLHVNHADTGVASFSLSGQPGTGKVTTTFQCDLTWYAATASTARAE